MLTTADKVAEAEKVLKAGEIDPGHILNRIGQIEAEVSAIIVRRQTEGGDNDRDGEQIALLQADAEGLRTILARANEQVALAKMPVAHAKTAHKTALAELAHEEQSALQDMLVRHIHALSGPFEATLDMLGQLGINGRQPWAPTNRLYDLIRKAHYHPGGRPL